MQMVFVCICVNEVCFDTIDRTNLVVLWTVVRNVRLESVFNVLLFEAMEIMKVWEGEW